MPPTAAAPHAVAASTPAPLRALLSIRDGFPSIRIFGLKIVPDAAPAAIVSSDLFGVERLQLETMVGFGPSGSHVAS